ncbi:hypothetical protein SLS57_000057 [Botryosphaeria dothidea]
MGQYERQFKKWGFRKNLKKREWEWYFRRERKRKREGKESQLKVDGVLMPKKRVMKAEKTYELTTLEKINMALQLVSPENKDSSSGQFQECFSGADLLLNINGQIRKRQQISAALTPTNGARKILGDSISSIMSSLCDSFTFDINLTTNHLLAHPQASWEYSLRFPAFYTPEQSDILRFLKSPQASPILQWLLHECSPTSDALSEVLFKKALLSRDLTVADMLIQHKKLDLNTLLPGPWRFPMLTIFPDLNIQQK